jgi:hypothetical protein
MSKFTLNYHKTRKIVLEDLEKQYIPTNSIEEPFSIRDLQCYNPIYNIFFEMSENNYDSIALNHRYHIQDLKHIVDSYTGEIVERDLFIKFAPLLDPVRYMIGKYKSHEGIRTLPSYQNKTHEKLSNQNNASYIDNFFCYLSSQILNHHQFLHGIDYYGSFLGIQKKYKMNLMDDIEYLMQSDYFNENKGKMYEIEQQDDPFANFGSRSNKNKLDIHNNSNVSIITLEDIVDISEDVDGKEDYSHECIYEKSHEEPEDDSSNSDINYSSEDDSDSEDDEDDDENHYENKRSKESTQKEEAKESEEESEDDEEDEDDEDDDYEDDDDDDDDDEDDDDDDDDDEEDKDTHETIIENETSTSKQSSKEISESTSDSDEYETEKSDVPLNGYIYDFPVQMICLEKCTGTLDELFSKKLLDLDSAASALFQVIIILYAYQKSFYFTHNDLHTNNIMYIETDKEYICYKVAGNYYKVPTYGRIFKLIDFGRAIYRFQGKTLCSDSFGPGGDASTQYNFEPFFNENKPRLDPNYSFDLCRLGCSIYDFILDIEEEFDDEFSPDPLQELIIKWVSDDNGKNVLYKKNGEERYPNFKLYKMIARTVHDKTPESQLSDPLFESFVIDKCDMNEEVVDLDVLVSYV